MFLKMSKITNKTFLKQMGEQKETAIKINIFSCLSSRYKNNSSKFKFKTNI